MRTMGEAIEKMKSTPDYKTRMNEEEVAALLTRVHYTAWASVFMPRNAYESTKEAFLKALDEPYEEEEEF